jgi:hypothetical protein
VPARGRDDNRTPRSAAQAESEDSFDFLLNFFNLSLFISSISLISHSISPISRSISLIFT